MDKEGWGEMLFGSANNFGSSLEKDKENGMKTLIGQFGVVVALLMMVSFAQAASPGAVELWSEDFDGTPDPALDPDLVQSNETTPMYLVDGTGGPDDNDLHLVDGSVQYRGRKFGVVGSDAEKFNFNFDLVDFSGEGNHLLHPFLMFNPDDPATAGINELRWVSIQYVGQQYIVLKNYQPDPEIYYQYVTYIPGIELGPGRYEISVDVPNRIVTLDAPSSGPPGNTHFEWDLDEDDSDLDYWWDDGGYVGLGGDSGVHSHSEYDNLYVEGALPDLLGDVNNDKIVGMADLTTVLTNRGMASPTWYHGDVAGSGGPGPDGAIDEWDYDEVVNNWGAVPPPEPPEAPGAVPEPSTLLLLGGAALAGVFRRRIKTAIPLLLLVSLLVVPSSAMAYVNYTVQSAGSSGIVGYDRVFDVYADTDNTFGVTGGLGTQEMLLTAAAAGDIYQDAAGSDTGPPTPAQIAIFPTLEFDSYVTLPVTFAITGGAVDIGGGPGLTFDTQTLDAGWSPSGGGHTGPGNHHIARFTLADWADVDYTITGFEEGSPATQGDTLTGSIGPMPISLRVAEVVDPGTPANHVAYDFFARVNTNMGGFELLLNTTNPGDIYQNSPTPDDPDDADAFDSYVSIGYPSAGEQPINTNVVGGAVDIGGSDPETFDTQNIDIAWAPEFAVGDTSHGEFHIARVTLKNGTIADFELRGWQTGDQDAPVSTGTHGLWNADLSKTGMISLIPGDVNFDGYVGGLDLTTIISNWGLTGATRLQGDLSGDGTVAGADYTEVVTWWGSGTPPPEPGAIPEPASLALLAIGGVLALFRRRK